MRSAQLAYFTNVEPIELLRQLTSSVAPLPSPITTAAVGPAAAEKVHSPTEEVLAHWNHGPRSGRVRPCLRLLTSCWGCETVHGISAPGSAWFGQRHMVEIRKQRTLTACAQALSANIYLWLVTLTRCFRNCSVTVLTLRDVSVNSKSKGTS